MGAQENSLNNFGHVVGYLLPGFTALTAARYLTGALDPWFVGASPQGPTVGGFLFITLASVAAGLAVSVVRWLVIDTLHHRTGIERPDWDFSRLGDRVAAFALIVDHHYAYYKAYANMVVALAVMLLSRRWAMGVTTPPDLVDAGLLFAIVVFFLGSRDALRRYYRRGGQLLGARRRPGVRQARGQRRTRGRRIPVVSDPASGTPS